MPPRGNRAPHVETQTRVWNFYSAGGLLWVMWGGAPPYLYKNNMSVLKVDRSCQKQTNYYIKRKKTTEDWINKKRGVSPVR